MYLTSVCDFDIVVDTNVLSHADNTGVPEQATSIEVLRWLQGSQILWVVDDNGKAAPNPSTSLMVAEYRGTLAPQGLGLVLFAWFLSSGRVRFAPRPTKATRDSIAKLIPRNKKDRVVLGAASGSRNRVLVSNDWSDFNAKVREDASSILDVEILCSEEACGAALAT